MSTWRCPHCATPQPESSRCWVCRRSSTCCATCRHYRDSIVERVGYCGLDPRRSALRGDELRACWEWPLPAVTTRSTEPAVTLSDRTPVRTSLTLVPVEVGLPAVPEVTPEGDRREPAGIMPSPAAPVGPEQEPSVWNLFPDLETA